MLGGEDFRGGQQGSLAPGVHYLQHGPQRHDCLAGAHLALQQPVHGAVLGELGGERLADGGLAGGQRERQLPVEGGQQAVRYRAPGGGFLGGQLGAAPGQGGLQDQGFLVAEPVPGALPVRRRLRCVDQPVGLRDRQELFPCRDLGGQRVRQGVEVGGLQQRRDRPSGWPSW